MGVPPKSASEDGGKGTAETRPYKVLFVEDNPTHAMVTRELFSLSAISRVEVDWIADFDQALEAILKQEHDAYLLDHWLGERTGLELLKTAAAAGCRAPFIMLTGADNPELDLEAMNAGAVDYLIKSRITADILERSIRYAIERQRVAEALRASREYARYVVDCSFDMIICVDLERRIIEFNRAAQEVFGYTAREAKTAHIDCLYATPEESLRIANAVLEHGQVVTEVTNIKKNGETFISLLAASVLRDERGNQIGFMGVSRDITVRKQMEAELQRLNSELELRVAERTGALESANSELRRQIEERQRIQERHEALISELNDALAKVKLLSGLLPICAHCKKIRDDRGYWNQIESFIRERSHAEFTHGICPDCAAGMIR